MSNALTPQFLRFIAVGVLNTLVGYGFYAAGIFLGLAPVIALLIATVLGCLFNYMSMGRLVFHSQSGRALVRFITMYALLYVINALLLKALISLGLGALLAQALLLPVMALSTFCISRFWVFQKRGAGL